MLSNDILSALKNYTANMQKNVALVLQTGVHSNRDELVDFLEKFVSVSDRLSLREEDLGARSGAH